MKRLKFSGPNASGDMAVLDSLSVGPRERIALIRVGDAQVLVGISAAGIVALSPLNTPIAIIPAARPSAFADRLRELMAAGRPFVRPKSAFLLLILALAPAAAFADISMPASALKRRQWRPDLLAPLFKF